MTDAHFMALALDEAIMAAASGEVPVGAVVVWQGNVIATGRNALISGRDPTAHAEIVALRTAGKILGNYRLGECELFVTLEPCTMCSGAILNARLKRVVFGAFEPRTGAAGSVVNLFAQSRLNHQTICLAGVLAEESRTLMQDFFHQRRTKQRELARLSHPLRDDALRTPDTAFGGLHATPYQPRYRSDLRALDRLRMHYLDEQSGAVAGSEAAALTYLCLHDVPGWSHDLRELIASLLDTGGRVVVPDLIGFGKSDKPKKTAFHSLEKHRQILVELVETLDLRNIVLVLPEEKNLLGLTLPTAAPLRYRGIRLFNKQTCFVSAQETLGQGLRLWEKAISPSDSDWTSSGKRSKARLTEPRHAENDAPFPSKSYQAGPLAFSAMVQAFIRERSEIFWEAEKFWQSFADT